jgi:hypothetical protein
MPAQTFKLGELAFVTGAIRLELRPPEVEARLWHSSELAVGIWMAMPEATVNEDDGTIAGQDDVGGAGKVATLEAKTVAERVKGTARGEFGFSVTSPYAGHTLRSPSRVEGVDHERQMEPLEPLCHPP